MALKVRYIDWPRPQQQQPCALSVYYSRQRLGAACEATPSTWAGRETLQLGPEFKAYYILKVETVCT